MVILYRIGFTNVGRRMLFHGKVCPLVAFGTKVLVTLNSSSVKFGGFSPAQVHSTTMCRMNPVYVKFLDLPLCGPV